MNNILLYFFESYFHQDWRDDYPSSLDVARAFNSAEPMEAKRALKRALGEMLEARELSQDTINKQGGNFKPERENLSVYDWIQQVLVIVED